MRELFRDEYDAPFKSVIKQPSKGRFICIHLNLEIVLSDPIGHAEHFSEHHPAMGESISERILKKEFFRRPPRCCGDGCSKVVRNSMFCDECREGIYCKCGLKKDREAISCDFCH